MGMHMFARADIAAGEADDLTVLAYRRTFQNGCRCHLVPGRYLIPAGNGPLFDTRADCESHTGDDDIVVDVKTYYLWSTRHGPPPVGLLSCLFRFRNTELPLLTQAGDTKPHHVTGFQVNLGRETQTNARRSPGGNDVPGVQ